MLSKQEFRQFLSRGICLLDGATGSNLILYGMPKGCSTEKWGLENPDANLDLQSAYFASSAQLS